jgi:excisionase family DNA binding protein
MTEERLTMSVREAAHALGISTSLVYELVRVGRLPGIRLGRRVVISRSALERFVDGCVGEALERDL